MSDEKATVAALQELKELGVQLCIDDFGIGHSSLSRLKRIPLDTLKIDRSFVRDLVDDPSDAAIVTAIITMAHGLGLRVVGEGVETIEQRSDLTERGCDEMQGYYFSPPRPVDAIEALLAEAQW
jgi:EAL domain-containing protein (putative c-di-GMP-specific phosphodiesterase class I)